MTWVRLNQVGDLVTISTPSWRTEKWSVVVTILSVDQRWGSYEVDISEDVFKNMRWSGSTGPSGGFIFSQNNIHQFGYRWVDDE